MIRIVKNVGQVSELKGKYILEADDNELGSMYAPLRFRAIWEFILYKLNFYKD